MVERLGDTRGPADDGLFNLWIFTEAEVQAQIVLCGESCSGGHLLKLLLAVPVEPDFRADGVAVALCGFEMELNPLLRRIDVVPVDEQRPILIGDDDIERAVIPEIADGDSARTAS